MTSKAGAISGRLLDPGTFLTRDDAAETLTKAGVRTTKATLENLAVRGIGPPYSVINGRAVYARAALEAWLEGRLSGGRAAGAT